MTTVANNEDLIRYIMDSNGKKTAVIIPIEIWNKLREEKKTGSLISPYSPKKYRGILKENGFNGREEEIKMRDEWE